MMGMRVFGAATVAALFIGAPAANAAIVSATYTGQVFAGFDQTGLFGAANSDLAGASYQVTYTFNTLTGINFSTPMESTAYGGTSVPAPTPSLGVRVTINGVSISSDLNGYFDQIYGYNDGAFTSEQYHSTQSLTNSVTNYIVAGNLLLPADITTPFSYSVQTGDSQAGTVSFSTFGAESVNTWATADISELTVTLISPGPTLGLGLWGLAALTFGGLYARVRRG